MKSADLIKIISDVENLFENKYFCRSVGTDLDSFKSHINDELTISKIVDKFSRIISIKKTDVDKLEKLLYKYRDIMTNEKC